MSTTLTGEDARREIRERLREAIEEAGSMVALSRKWEVSVSYLSYVLRGKRHGGPKILRKLGLSHVVDAESHPLRTIDVATLFGVNHRRIAKWCSAGNLPHYRIPGRLSDLRFNPQDVAAYARKRGRHDVAEKIEGRVSL